MPKGIFFDDYLRNGLEKNVGVSKERAANYVLFLKKHIENDLNMNITNKQAITIEKLIAKSIFLGELYIFGLVENNKQIIGACEALKLNSFYEACLFNYFYSVNPQLPQGDLREILNMMENEYDSGIVAIPFDEYTSENIVFPNKKDILLYNNFFEKEALWLVKKLDIVKFIESQQNFSLERYDYPLTAFGEIKFFSIKRRKQNDDEIFLISKKKKFSKGFKEIMRMKKTNSILMKNENHHDIGIRIVPLFALLKRKHDCYLITKYVSGKTYDDILRVGINKRNNIEQLREVKRLLFNNGIGWKDFAPRNIIRHFPDNDNMPTYYLCDFERASVIKEDGITKEEKACIEEHAVEEFVDLLSQKELDYLFPSLHKNSPNPEKNISLTEIESSRIRTLLKRRSLLFSIGDKVYTKKKHIDTIRHELRLCARPLRDEKKMISTLYVFDLLTEKIAINYRIQLTELLLRNMNTENHRYLIILLDALAKAYITLLLEDEYNSRIIDKSTNINAEISTTFAEMAIDSLSEIAESDQLERLLRKKHFLCEYRDKKYYDKNDRTARLLEFFGHRNINYMLSSSKNGRNSIRRDEGGKK